MEIERANAKDCMKKIPQRVCPGIRAALWLNTCVGPLEIDVRGAPLCRHATNGD